jgi:hypothetical protein
VNATPRTTCSRNSTTSRSTTGSEQAHDTRRRMMHQPTAGHAASSGALWRAAREYHDTHSTSDCVTGQEVRRGERPRLLRPPVVREHTPSPPALFRAVRSARVAGAGRARTLRDHMACASTRWTRDGAARARDAGAMAPHGRFNLLGYLDGTAASDGASASWGGGNTGARCEGHT